MRNRQTVLFRLIFGVALSAAAGAPHALELPAAISETLASNPELQAERREADARNREVRSAKGGFLPEVELLGGYGHQEWEPAGSNRSTDLERSEAQLSVRQMVFDGFNTRSEYRNQQAREQSSLHRVTAVAEQLSLDTIQSYLEVLKREDIERLARDTLDFHQDIYDRMEKRAGSGVGSRADFDQISGRLALARTNFFNARANLIDAKVDFQRIVGRLPADGELSLPAGAGAVLPGTVEDAVAKAIDNHPILRVATADVTGVDHQYQQTKSTFYPQLSVDIAKSLDRNIDGVDGEVEDLQVMLRMRYKLYNGGSDQARRQQFAHLAEKAREIRNNARRQVEQEVRLSWVALETLREQVPSLEAHVRDSAATKAAYLNQYDLGRRTLLDLLNTENENITARQTLISARHDLIYHEYRVFQAMGDLLSVIGVNL